MISDALDYKDYAVKFIKFLGGGDIPNVGHFWGIKLMLEWDFSFYTFL